ncbi:MAG TPA: aquaporin [Dehalococcoidia bacterium]|jgi:MIP family channel proteins|nr:aquaporin [Dehalococcoidia bacterium]
MATESASTLGLEDVRSPRALKGALGELIGTLFLVLVTVGTFASVVYFSGADAVPVIALAQGLVFGMLIATLGGVSNGYLNPAVTLAMIITGQVSVLRGVLYVIAQFIGAIVGVLLLRAVILKAVLQAVPGAGGLYLSEPGVDEAWKGFLLEGLGTFLLVWTIFAVDVRRRFGAGVASPLYIGLAFAAVSMFLIPLTGAGLNPARAFGPSLVLPGVAQDVPGRWSDAWVYYVGPLVGAALAGLSYYVLYILYEDEDEQ